MPCSTSYLNAEPRPIVHEVVRACRELSCGFLALMSQVNALLAHMLFSGRPLAENQIAALWRLDFSLREKTFWKMLYESAARADEVLCLNVEDLYPQDKRGKITAKGGATEWIHWQSGTAQLLPRLIARRTRGPLFLTDRKAPAGTATLDVCEETSRARLFYRRGEEIFEESTRLLANPLARPEDVEDLAG